MYTVKNYLTDEIVAVVSSKKDAIALTTAPRGPNDPVLIYEKNQ